jgi:hypothetical protein
MVCTVSGDTVSGRKAGTCTVAANQPGDANYNPATQASQTLTVAKGSAQVLLADLSQVQDGAAKEVSVATIPAGLSVTITYNGSGSAPVVAGSYEAVATVDDADYQGSASATLVIEPPLASVGDTNGDGSVGIDDAILILKGVAGLPPTTRVHIEADSDGDQRLTVGDALFILRRVAAGE